MSENTEMEISEVAKRFIAVGLAKTTVYRWIRQYQATGNIERRIAPGRPVKIATKKNIRSLALRFNNRHGRSQRVVAGQFGCSQQYISAMLRKHTTIRCLKKLKRPLMNEQQKQAARPKCRAMYRLYGKQDFIIDDESYFTLSNTGVPGNDRFYTNDLNTTPESVKYNLCEKYPPKLLVWLAISPKGVTKPHFLTSGLAVNADTYLGILKSKLEPLIKRCYKDGGFVFWPDLASSHYASKVLDYLKNKNIPIVLRSINPANLPKVRPIEDFWANLKA